MHDYYNPGADGADRREIPTAPGYTAVIRQDIYPDDPFQNYDYPHVTLHDPAEYDYQEACRRDTEAHQLTARTPSAFYPCPVHP